MYLGSWKIGDNLTFACNTHTAATGAATDADAVPAYRVYEDETGTTILNGNMALLDDANTTGFYSEQIALTAANGFEKGKCYTVYLSAAVAAITGTMHHTFQIGAEVDSGFVVHKTTIATVTSQSVFVLTAGSADDDAYNKLPVRITDATTATQVAHGFVSDYVGGTLTLTLIRDPGVFTIAAGDFIEILSYPHPTNFEQTSIDAAGRMTSDVKTLNVNLGAGVIREIRGSQL